MDVLNLVRDMPAAAIGPRALTARLAAVASATVTELRVLVSQLKTLDAETRDYEAPAKP